MASLAYLGKGLTGPASGLIPNYRGGWLATNSYGLGDLITLGSKLYVCTTAVAGGATPAIIGTPTSATSGATTGANITLPTGSIAGDLAVLAMCDYQIVPIPPTGMTSAAAGTNGSIHVSIFTKTLTSGDITSGYLTIPTQSGAGSGGWGGTLTVARNVAVGTSTSTTATASTASVTPSGYPAFALSALGGFGSGAVTGATWTGGSAVTFGGTAVNGDQYCASGYDTVNSGSSISRTFTNVGGGFTDSCTVTLALAPGSSFPSSDFTEIAAVHDGNGRIQVSDPAASTDVVNLEYLSANANMKAGSQTTPYAAKTANYALTSTDSTVGFSSSSALTMTLPTAVGITGTEYTIKNEGTAAGLLATTSSQTIDGLTSIVLGIHDAVSVQSDGANWRITSRDSLNDAISVVGTSGAAQTLLAPPTVTLNYITLSAACTITMPTAVAGAKVRLALNSGSAGSHTVTWTTVKWPGGTAPTLTSTASKTDLLEFICVDGTNWLGIVLGLGY